MEWRDALFAEKTLYQAYRKAQKVASTRFNYRVAACVFVVLTFFMALRIWLLGEPLSYVSAILTTRNVAMLGFTYTTSILGFLITGFAIFASITRPQIFILLAKLPYEETGISRLHFIFFNFLFVFVHYICFLIACIFVLVGLGSKGPFSDFLKILADCHALIITYGGAALVAVGVGWFAFLLMLLKSFIWNIYQAIILTIATASLSKEELDELIRGD
ncbi:hypothetical protein [Ochrobactrum sp. Marseille-Q0166]|uniref:hypothetical protein n=1 Tax=Ochrobactrum sp. Marseille-Q0166 TaxID=2761105 RepID=UPI0016553264|nr:hypothetical protein [Ochrobactrum sp. Marseille-Q0166]MBC8718168.1 hypothetical protein [Ochrobactrum sp. Marseille-Q0166]